MTKLLAVGEIKNGELRSVSLEVITAGKKMNEDAEIVGVLMGDDVGSSAEEMLAYGVDRLIKIEHPNLLHYTTDGYKQALMQVIEQESPTGLIMGHTSLGKDLAPRIAVKLQAGLVSDVIDIKQEDGILTFTRPIYSGKAFEKKTISGDFTFITIRPNNFPSPDKIESSTGDITTLEADIKDIRTTIQDIVKKSTDGKDLSEAKIVVAGGRGVKSKEGFDTLYELADALGAAVGASRGACDADYCDYSLQIGQTGKVVTPDLYIAVGISGAIQHLAGMSNSKVIIAINKDPRANIFEVADYGIVGDLFQIVPLLVEGFGGIKI